MVVPMPSRDPRQHSILHDAGSCSSGLAEWSSIALLWSLHSCTVDPCEAILAVGTCRYPVGGPLP